MATDHPKKRRRRSAERLPVSGWLTPSDQLKGNVGTISHHLFADLFRYKSTSDPSLAPCYIAIAPWYPLPQSLVEDVVWTILPIRARNESEQEFDTTDISSIRFPATSQALLGFLQAVQDSAFAKNRGKENKGIEVRITDVEPLALDTVFVTVDGDALNKHEEVQRKFGGGFDHTRANGFAGKGKGKAKAIVRNKKGGDDATAQAQDLDGRLTSAVREALASSTIVRETDMLPLPLPAHPITHVPLPPARISLCEPVRQGLLKDDTRVIVNRVSHTDPAVRSLPSLAGRQALYSVFAEDGNDTSNGQFFSAAENKEKRQMVVSTPAESSSSDDSTESDSSSDDSVQNMTSMITPQLPTQNLSILPSKTAATPRTNRVRAQGVSTPGSVFSNFTATTARQGFRTKAKSFRARGLLFRIPDDLLHPRPAADEDEEARIFVDLKTLIKIGCFSGDWVQVATSNHSRSGLWGVNLSAFDADGSSADFRPVRIYGLSGLSQKSKPRFPRRSGKERRATILEGPGAEGSTTEVWLSPIMLANLGQSEFIQIAPLLEIPQETGALRAKVKRTKVDLASSPPIAKEMTFFRISTPLSTERALQAGIFAALKHHFEIKKRVLKQGDLIALPVDIGLSRLVAPPSNISDADREVEELLTLPSDGPSSTSPNVDIAWFRVAQITTFGSGDNTESFLPGIWGGTACIEPQSTGMRQAGSLSSKIPSALDSPWQYYLGTRASVRSSTQGASLMKYTAPMHKQQIAPLRRRLRELLAAATSPRALHLGMDPMVILLHSTQRNIGKATLVLCAASDLGLHIFDIDAHDMSAEGGSAGDVKTEAILKARMERATSCDPACTAILIRHVDTLTADRMVTVLKETVSETRVIIATSTDIESVPDGIRSLFTHEFEVVAPDEGEREGILKNVIEDRAIRLAHDVDLASIAVKSAALVAGDLVDIIDRAIIARQNRLDCLISNELSIHSESQPILIRDVLASGGENIRCVIKADFDFAVEAARKNFADAIGAPKIPNVGWDDVGGLENVKDAVMETIQLPLERPELFAKGMKKRSGILFYGPPGTGKTLLAKAIATEFSLNFFSVKGPELLNMYIGESEANVRRVFQRARDARPCVVFFDELDSVAPKRGNQGDSGGVMDRIVSQLLAELDGMSNGEEGGGGVFVIGATNRPDLLDQALLRPGRFDKMLYLGVSDTHAKQLTILEALTRKFTMHPETSLQRVAESLPFTYTGADLYALCSDAMLKAITRQASAVDAKIKALPSGPVTTAYFFDHLVTEEDIAVMVSEGDFVAAQRELVGSVRSVYVATASRVYEIR